MRIILVITVLIALSLAEKTNPTNGASKSTSSNPDTRSKRNLFDIGRLAYGQNKYAERRITNRYPFSRAYISPDESFSTNYHVPQYNALPEPSNNIADQQFYSPQYIEPPEPIIEIIIKESNESFPATQPRFIQKKKKEKVEVFYVNYKKDKDNKIYLETPISSLSQSVHQEEHEEKENDEFYEHITAAPSISQKTTTLRTIIHPDSEKFHSSSGIRVTFGSEGHIQNNDNHHEQDEESVIRSVVAVPQPTNTLSSVLLPPQSIKSENSFYQFYQQNPNPRFLQSFSNLFNNNQTGIQYNRPGSSEQNFNYQQLPIFNSGTQLLRSYNKQPQINNQNLESNIPRYFPKANIQNQNQNNHQHLDNNAQRHFSKTNIQSQSTQNQAQNNYQQLENNAQRYFPKNIHQNQQNQNQRYKFHQKPYFPEQQTNLRNPQLPKYRPQPIPLQGLKTEQLQSSFSRPSSFGPPQQTTKFIQQNFTNQQPENVGVIFNSWTQLPPKHSQQNFSINQPSKFPSSVNPNPHYVSFYQQLPLNKEPELFRVNQQLHQNSATHKPFIANQQFKNFIPEVEQYSFPKGSKQPIHQTNENLNASQIVKTFIPDSHVYKSIPRFEQHITENIAIGPANQQYQTKQQPQKHVQSTKLVYMDYSPNINQQNVLKDVPAPNLGNITPNLYVSQYSPSTSHPPTTHQQFDFGSTSRPQNVINGFSQPHLSSTKEPQHGSGSGGTAQSEDDNIQIITPIPSIQTHYLHQQEFIDNFHRVQPEIIPNSQPVQNFNRNQHQQQQNYLDVQSRTNQAQLEQKLNNSQDIIKILPQNKYSVAQSVSVTQYPKFLPPKSMFLPTPLPTNSINDATKHTYSSSTESTTAKTTTTKQSNKSFHIDLPDEVPEDLRQQLISSGILENAQISVLDYDKVGDIDLENLPPEHLANFYGSGGRAQISESNKILTVVKPNGEKLNINEKQIQKTKESKTLPHGQNVDLKVVRFDSSNQKSVTDKYIRQDSSILPTVDINDRQYNRYLPLKVNGAQFPIPDVEELKGKKISSVVVLAPVDTLQESIENEPEGRQERDIVSSKNVKFIAGDSLKQLLKKPSRENFRTWLDKEARTHIDLQSVILLVVRNPNTENDPEIFMYEINSQEINKLNGDLSSAFVKVAEENANAQDIENVPISDRGIIAKMTSDTNETSEIMKIVEKSDNNRRNIETSKS